MKQAVVGAFFGLFSLAAPCADLTARPWPPESHCSDCSTLQFGGLEMRFSPGMVGRFFVPASGQPFVTLVPSDQALPQGPVLQAMEGQALRKRYQRLRIFEQHRIGTPLAFYELLGDSSHKHPSLDIARKAESIVDAVAYERFEKGALTVVRIRHADPRLNIAYLFTDRPDTYYMISGDMPESVWNQWLSTLRSASIP
ncbi:hypothetical protein [Paracidovorax konjaci]|uniref:Uncharacterized protein n=1 Tax=Paracidovorax konjaci TaxID=32040 RepID=A0A1I1VHR3_9BURK|nr:hypothetical protein [Paracidovorax konjaci]SFD82496.1 hypothetical protein SAMN04489710_106332 [Paracidovorax konjaci]